MVTRKRIIEVLFNDYQLRMAGGYAFLIRLDLMFSMSLSKELQLLQFLKDLSIKHLIMIILYENNVTLLKFMGSPP